MAKSKPKAHLLKPTDIVIAVRKVLEKVKRNHNERSFLTAYQILDRLPTILKTQLIRERGLGGNGSKKRYAVEESYAAASVVSKAAAMLSTEVRYLDTNHITLTVKSQSVKPSPRLCGIFRLKEEKPIGPR